MDTAARPRGCREQVVEPFEEWSVAVPARERPGPTGCDLT
jgi:hypothetical protein